MASDESIENRLKQFTAKLDATFTEFADILPIGHTIIVHPMPEYPDWPWFAAILVMGQGNDPTVSLLESLGRAICFSIGTDYDTDPSIEHIRGFVAFLRTLPLTPFADGQPVGEA